MGRLLIVPSARVATTSTPPLQSVFRPVPTATTKTWAPEPVHSATKRVSPVPVLGLRGAHPAITATTLQQ